MPGKYYFAGPIPSNEALSRGLLYPNEHLQKLLALYLYGLKPYLLQFLSISVYWSRIYYFNLIFSQAILARTRYHAPLDARPKHSYYSNNLAPKG